MENKIAPYMNNYGQKIIDQNLDNFKIDKIFQELIKLVKNEKDHKYDKKFIELIKDSTKAKSFFTYIELYKV